jgi:DDE superfamily endonuclease
MRYAHIARKIVWPETWVPGSANFSKDVFIVSVDGTHCAINEPNHPELSQDPAYFSHKLHGAALSYEIALSLWEDKIVWINGPFPAGTSDSSIFQYGGLKDMIPAGKRAVGDKGYVGMSQVVTTRNRFDQPFVREFKSRARARQESINQRIKNFQILDIQFRHSIAKHEHAFHAVCVVVQYQLENGSPLFSI